MTQSWNPYRDLPQPAPAPNPYRDPSGSEEHARPTVADNRNDRSNEPAVTVGVAQPAASSQADYTFAASSNEQPTSPSVDVGDANCRFGLIRSARGLEEFQLHMAALEWSLDAPITIQSIGDAKSLANWKDRVQPYHHQVQNLITFCRRAPVALLADDVGLGKTISAGLILSELIERGKVTNCLVLCPSLLLPQWREELANKFGIEGVDATGSGLRTALKCPSPVKVTTYHSARSNFDLIRKSNFDMIILDEAHKLRNLHGNGKPPGIATAVHDALRDRVFKYVLMLTATPIQNRLWDLYSLVDLLAVAKGHPNPLGDPGRFAARYLDNKNNRATQLNAGVKDEFRGHLSNYVVRTRRSDSKLDFPERTIKLVRAKASPVEERLTALVQELFESKSLNGFMQSSIAVALMSSPEALSSQLENMARNGTVPESIATRAKEITGQSPLTGKLERLLKLVTELREQRSDWRLVVFTTRKETQAAIGTLLEARQIRCGYIRGGSASQNQATIKSFWADPPGVNVILSTDAGAEGVNLQKGNVLVNYDLPWNPMIVEQRIGRVQRLGSTHASVSIINLVLAGSVEEHVVARLSEKLQAVCESLGDIESILESAGGDLDADEGFESMIRKLVVGSLLGQDVNRAMQRASESIERGRKVFDEEKRTVEQTLGRLDAMHNAGPKVPEIKPITPSVPVREFVDRALRADGANIRHLGGELFEMRVPGRHAERFTFDEKTAIQETTEDESVFSNNAPRLFKPGKPSFERLAQSWVEKHGALVREVGLGNPEDVHALARTLVQQLEGAEFEDVVIKSHEVAFQGELVCRASAAVSHDRFEKLVRVQVRPVSGRVLDDAEVERFPPVSGEVATDNLVPNATKQVLDAIRTDDDFTKFRQFYASRLNEELQTAGGNPAVQRDLRQRLSTVESAEAVAVRGARYGVAEAIVRFRVHGEGPFDASVRIVPALREISWLCDFGQCSLTGARVPASCLRVCAVTGKQALSHLLVRSAISERWCLSEHARTCEVTGDKLIADEIGKSCVSGKAVGRNLLIPSAVSGRLALAEEMDRCEITGASILPGESCVSDVSTKRFRRDQHAISILSGRSGHASELIRTVDPDGLVMPDEAAKSDVSGTWVARDRLVASEAPPFRKGFGDEVVSCELTGGRFLSDEVFTSAVSGKRCDSRLRESSHASGKFAARAEMAVCEQTNRRLLPSELEKCEVSRKLVDSRLLGRSDVSGKRALKQFLEMSASGKKAAFRDELVACEESRALFAPDELARCVATGKTVDSRLTGQSAVSGKVAMLSQMRTCEVTSKLALHSETAACSLTGKVVLASLVDTCMITDRIALKSQMRRSAASNRYFTLDDVALAAVRSRTPFKSVELTCNWLGGVIAATEGTRCNLCGLEVAAKFVNDDGELKVFRDLLNGDAGERIPSLSLALLKVSHPSLAKLQDVVGLSTLNGVRWFLCCRVSSGFLGMSSQFVGLVVRNVHSPEITTPVVVGTRKAGKWHRVP